MHPGAANFGLADGSIRYPISGTVTYQGKPVPVGSILFQPDPEQNNSGPVGSAAIQDGAYDTRRDGQGFSGGPPIVIVEAFDGQNIDPDYNPYGLSLVSGYMQPHDLPEADATLDIELSQRKSLRVQKHLSTDTRSVGAELEQPPQTQP